MSFTVLDIPINHLSHRQLDTLLRRWLHEPVKRMIVTPNAEMILAAKKDSYLSAALHEAHLSLPDAASLRFAVAALTDGLLRYRHTGIDTLERLAAICAEEGKTLSLCGGSVLAGKKAVETLKKKHPNLTVSHIDLKQVSYIRGAMHVAEELLDEIRQKKPHVLAVALGHGKQEVFLAKYLAKLPSVHIAIGVGGAIDLLSGILPRAPIFMRQMGLEWFWRLILQPTRIKRIMRATIVFPLHVAYDTAKRKRFLKGSWRAFHEILLQIRGR